jgi:hypothetical protein
MRLCHRYKILKNPFVLLQVLREDLKTSDIHKQPLPLRNYCGIRNIKIVALLLIPQKRGCPNGFRECLTR